MFTKIYKKWPDIMFGTGKVQSLNLWVVLQFWVCMRGLMQCLNLQVLLSNTEREQFAISMNNVPQMLMGWHVHLYLQGILQLQVCVCLMLIRLHLRGILQVCVSWKLPEDGFSNISTKRFLLIMIKFQTSTLI